MKKILVIGTSGSGKSTLAKQLSEFLELPFFPSDDFYWGENWTLVSAEKVQERIDAVLAHDAWILDGNFDDVHEIVWRQADCIVWLDYSLERIFQQVAWRNLSWWMTQQVTWSGNKMTWHRAISGIRHAIRSHALKREKYPGWLSELSDVTSYRLRSRREVKVWLQEIGQISNQ